MESKELAKMVALAKILGVEGNVKEIAEKLSGYYSEAEKALRKEVQPAKVEPGKRPF